MKRLLLMAVLVPGCGADEPVPVEHPQLHFDVVVTQDVIDVYATEVDRPDACDHRPFAHPGECDEPADGWLCNETYPADWLAEMRVEQNGEPIAAGFFEAPRGGGFGGLDISGRDDVVLFIADRDGAEVAVPIHDAPRPLPMIDDVAVTLGEFPAQDDVAITWHTDPPATSAVVELSNGFGGPRCHVEQSDDVTMVQTSIGAASWSAWVTALAPVSKFDTAFGEAEVWVGTLAYTDIVPPGAGR